MVNSLANCVTPDRKVLGIFLLPTAVGAFLGAWLLRQSTAEQFAFVVPGLILLSSLLLAFPLPKGFKKPWIAVPVQSAIAVYGGYFGAAQGIAIIAVVSLLVKDTKESNAIKNWLQFFVVLVASSFFVLSGMVEIFPALALGFGGCLGGFIAAKLSQIIPSVALRQTITYSGFTLFGFYLAQL